ncbi:hypothetical protein C1645_736650 [Glomus cerebriforme]|uniref:Uncharacterized protein n=1 Tax=Glomus cerebriforme TaxID=658196 RepID=A0A397T6T0_9GLOM|nr:hypothetical protein C1645_736650 [Glomus cerebriforme]
MYIMSRKELYMKSEIKEFEKSIINWYTNFKSIFAPLSSTECKFPKLHSWHYYAENGKILRTSGEFQSKEWFSNVAVTFAKDQEIQYGSDEGAWYGKARKFGKINQRLIKLQFCTQ